jgi:excisionase family DNA binding protein
MNPDLLSTGEVARLFGVSRDAVLKWIRKGKLPATRTPGGHYRVPKEACYGLSLPRSEEAETEPIPPLPAGDPEEMRCWEYFATDGALRQACLNCLVYLARAQRCYRLAELGEEAGHQLHFCKTDCRECSFYRACQGLAAEALVLTRDDSLVRRLLREVDPKRVSLRFARSGYEASGIVSTFKPALVLMDGTLPEVRSGRLVESVQADDRLPGARVYVGIPEGEEGLLEHLSAIGVPAPFSAQLILGLVESIGRSETNAPRGVA